MIYKYEILEKWFSLEIAFWSKAQFYQRVLHVLVCCLPIDGLIFNCLTNKNVNIKFLFQNFNVNSFVFEYHLIGHVSIDDLPISTKSFVDCSCFDLQIDFSFKRFYFKFLFFFHFISFIFRIDILGIQFVKWSVRLYSDKH